MKKFALTHFQVLPLHFFSRQRHIPVEPTTLLEYIRTEDRTVNKHLSSCSRGRLKWTR